MCALYSNIYNVCNIGFLFKYNIRNKTIRIFSMRLIFCIKTKLKHTDTDERLYNTQ